MFTYLISTEKEIVWRTNWPHYRLFRTLTDGGLIHLNSQLALCIGTWFLCLFIGSGTNYLWIMHSFSSGRFSLWVFSSGGFNEAPLHFGQILYKELSLQFLLFFQISFFRLWEVVLFSITLCNFLFYLIKLGLCQRRTQGRTNLVGKSLFSQACANVVGMRSYLRLSFKKKTRLLEYHINYKDY